MSDKTIEYSYNKNHKRCLSNYAVLVRGGRHLFCFFQGKDSNEKQENKRKVQLKRWKLILTNIGNKSSCIYNEE